jgi:hypothetical protein
MDIVYIIGSGSQWKNNEIRYSLRSVEKYMLNVEKIFVIGNDPGFLKNAIVKPYPDIYPKLNASGNVARKLLYACSLPELADEFLFFNDDFIILQPVDANNVDTYNKGNMAQYPAKHFRVNDWRKRMKRTLDTLAYYKLPTLNYDYHAPMQMNKYLFLQVMAKYNYEVGIGLLYRSLYGNTLGIESKKMTCEKKIIFGQLTLKAIDRHLEGATFMAFSDAGLNDQLKYWLQVNYPDQSKYEETDIPAKITNRTIDIREWIDNGHDYAKGIELFIRYYPNKVLTPRINLTETEIIKNKLIKILTSMLVDID